MLIAHAFGVPVEELLIPLVSGGGTLLLALRAWVGGRRYVSRPEDAGH
jgi:hypothetical protein